MGSEEFVDVSYRGIEVGASLKMLGFGPTTAYVELTTPMPVGTTLEVATAAGVTLRATVVRIQEQVAGAEMPPGMLVRATGLEGDAASWWKAAVTRVDPVIPEPRRHIPTEPEPDEEQVAAAAKESAPSEDEAEEARVVAEAAVDDEDVGVEEPADEERQPKRTQIMDVAEIQAAIAAGGDVADLSDAASNGVPDTVESQPTDKNAVPSGDSSKDDNKKKRKRRRRK